MSRWPRRRVGCRASHRLNVFPILIPPLLSRRADIGDLARRFAAEEGKRVRGLTAGASSMLAAYD